jgi:hypothetical protein
LYLLTGNQRGNAHEFEALGLDVVIAKNAAEKQSFVRTLDSENLVAV